MNYKGKPGKTFTKVVVKELQEIQFLIFFYIKVAFRFTNQSVIHLTLKKLHSTAGQFTTYKLFYSFIFIL